MSGWTLAIDFGTTHTAAAVLKDGEAIPLEFNDGTRRIPSPAWVGVDGTVYVGRSAQNQRAMAPERYVEEPKSLLGRGEVTTIDGTDYPVADLVGAVLGEVVYEASRLHGGAPTEIRLTHPAGWGTKKIDALVGAGKSAGIESPVLVPEPEAAAFAVASNLVAGEKLAVYDLGGGTFDTAVLERTAEGFELSGPPDGMTIGGERFDDRLFELVGRAIGHDEPDAWKDLMGRESKAGITAAINLRTSIREAKEELSRYPSQNLIVPPPFEIGFVLIQRDEFEELIEADIAETFAILDKTIESSGAVSGDLQGIYLTGGSSRLRLVEDMANGQYPGRVFTDNDPKAVVSVGALSWGSGAGADSSPRPRPPAASDDEVAHLYEPAIRVRVPRGWSVTESLQIWTGEDAATSWVDGTAREGSAEAGDTPERFALREASELRDLPGYREIESGEAYAFGAPGYRHVYERDPLAWEEEPSLVIAMYQVEGTTLLDASAEIPMSDLEELRELKEAVLAALRVVPPRGGMAGSSADLNTYGQRLSVLLYEGWTTTEFLLLSEPSDRVSVAVSTPVMGIGWDARQLLENEISWKRMLDGYRPGRFDECVAFGREGWVHDYSAVSRGRSGAETLLACVVDGRGFLAQASHDTDSGSNVEAQLTAAIDALEIDLGPGDR